MESCWKGILSLFCPISGLWRRDYKLSLGASFYRQKEQMSFDRLYQEADQAMYASKKQAGFGYDNLSYSRIVDIIANLLLLLAQIGYYKMVAKNKMHMGGSLW